MLSVFGNLHTKKIGSHRKTEVFHFMLLPTKSNNKILLFGDHFGPILPIFRQRFSATFFVSRFISVGNISKRLMNRFQERLVTDILTDELSSNWKSMNSQNLSPRGTKNKLKSFQQNGKKYFTKKQLQVVLHLLCDVIPVPSSHQLLLKE